MLRLRTALALFSGLAIVGTVSSASAEEPTSKPAATKLSKSNGGTIEVAAVKASVGGSAGTAGVGASADAPSGPPPAADWEEKWVPWDTGEAEADMGFAFFGHLGVGSRLNEGPAGDPAGPNGLRIGITGIFRPIRYFGFGVGFEHADIERTRTDLPDQHSYDDAYREMNNLWIDARAYPLRFDPFAMYVNIAGAFAFQNVHTSAFLNPTPENPGTGTTFKCDGSGDVGMGMKAGLGAELALASGAVLWAELGPDYYLLSEKELDGCDLGAGNAFVFGMRGGFAVGFERTRLQKEAPPPPPAPKDSDGDGIADNLDACPSVAGVANADPKKNGCPPDQDGDGFLDAQDACPTEPGVADPDPKKNGCPPPKDRDADLVTDELDACPDIPGIKTEDPKTNGCPGDTDGDGFRDDQDACPQEKGQDDPDPSKRGCPKLVRVTDNEIIILEQVQFDFGKATIKKESDPLLDSVAQVLKEHPEILKVEVQGHTDSKGSKNVNTKLSQDRATAVQKALEKRGVESSRLVSKGYGPEKPIADNATDDGRAKNRRVQFIVVDKKAKAPLQTLPGLQAPPAAPAPAPTP
ncbi:MAG: OmpA family protein [Myxococcales bacterium]|nr:OmpA family protein [Myxococcales bacterium]